MIPTTIFIHIPKTGGTSLRSLFEDHYGDRLLRVYRSGPEPRVHPDEIASITAQQAGAPAVFGHFAFGIHEHLPGEARYAAVLRDPVMRVVSHYYLYVRRFSRGNTSGNRLEMAIASGELTLADFGRGNIPRKRKRPLPSPSQNLMTRFLSGPYPPCPTTPDDPALLADMVGNDYLGARGSVAHADGLNVFTPG